MRRLGISYIIPCKVNVLLFFIGLIYKYIINIILTDLFCNPNAHGINFLLIHFPFLVDRSVMKERNRQKQPIYHLSFFIKAFVMYITL